MPEREAILTVLIRPSDEQRVADLVAQRFPDMPRIKFGDAEDDPSLRVQWEAEHVGVDLADRRCREVLVDTSSSTAQRLAEQVLDVISPHARTEDAMAPPFPAIPDEFPWSAQTPLWNSAKGLDTFYGLAVFELGTTDGTGKYFREDSYLIYADDFDDAQAKFEAIAREQEYEARDGDDRSYVRLAHLIDLAPTLYDVTGSGTVDLYSRHFASIEDYASFEMKLGGRDPLADPKGPG